MKERVLLTGATGFLGQYVVRQLTEAGYKVNALCRGAAELPKGAKVVRGDILDDASVRKAARGCHVLLHCAGKVSRDMDDALELQEVNTRGTRVVLDAARESGIGRAVVASTSGTVAVSDSADDIATEETETPLHLINRWPYYRSKLYAEQEALSRNSSAFEVLSVNPTLLLGPGDVNGSSTEDVRNFLNQKIPVVPAGGISFVDARDAAAGMILAMEHGKPGHRYLLTAANWDLRTFFGRLARVSNLDPPMLNVPSSGLGRQLGSWLVEKGAEFLGPDPVSVDMANHYWYADSTKAEEELGWTHREPLDTLLDTVNDLRKRASKRSRKAILSAHA